MTVKNIIFYTQNMVILQLYYSIKKLQYFKPAEEGFDTGESWLPNHFFFCFFFYLFKNNIYILFIDFYFILVFIYFKKIYLYITILFIYYFIYINLVWNFF